MPVNKITHPWNQTSKPLPGLNEKITNSSPESKIIRTEQNKAGDEKLRTIICRPVPLSIEQVQPQKYPHLSPDNPIFELFAIENQEKDDKRVQKALEVVNGIAGKLKQAIKEAHEKGKKLSIPEEVDLAYKIIREDFQIKYGELTYLYDGLSQAEPILDCDTGCHLFISLGHEFGWSFSAILAMPRKINGPGHAFLKLNQPGDRTWYYETTNNSWFFGQSVFNLADLGFFTKIAFKYLFSTYHELNPSQLVGLAATLSAHDHDKNEDYKNVVRLLSIAIEKQAVPGWSTLDELYAWRGYGYLELKNEAAAFADFKKALELKPENFDALMGMSELYANSPTHVLDYCSRHEYAKAREAAEFLVKLHPDQQEFLELYQYVLRHQKEYLAMQNGKKSPLGLSVKTK